ncbi:hypothetical protein THAOC_01267 [Thalassiosira oceanica]|uniref:Uncharacterized protein n=1 Tax=Thalassiosira oceanica TaxID=159749 RepID=K0THK0_THAOC|nr:hypothetical protein THAOC_01267 [Thalassiosira oceanica]|eukprot:EJK76940.1 hypothetical protein THAOC_01267 [Thalassiosira oceanica]
MSRLSARPEQSSRAAPQSARALTCRWGGTIKYQPFRRRHARIPPAKSASPAAAAVFRWSWSRLLTGRDAATRQLKDAMSLLTCPVTVLSTRGRSTPTTGQLESSESSEWWDNPISGRYRGRGGLNLRPQSITPTNQRFPLTAHRHRYRAGLSYHLPARGIRPAVVVYEAFKSMDPRPLSGVNPMHQPPSALPKYPAQTVNSTTVAVPAEGSGDGPVPTSAVTGDATVTGDASQFSSNMHQRSPMIAGIAHLKDKQKSLLREIDSENAVKGRLEAEMTSLQMKLETSRANLARLDEAKIGLEKTLQECQMVHSKIEESSKNLLSVIKRESRSLESNLKERKVDIADLTAPP